MPRLRAADTPAFDCRISRMRASRKLAATAPVPSVDPSSTTTSDQSRCVCASTDAIASPTHLAALYAGTTTPMCMRKSLHIPG
jgi:hypothetical protein